MKITTMFAFLAVQEGTEGLVAFGDSPVAMMPLVGADMNRAESLLPVVQAISNRTGQSIRLVKFTTREEMQVISPGAVAQ